ncbi:hypothetical protein FW739_23145, partial [Salmonella enterica subsp. enterica serovar Abony]|nr:hypothetical protein [Salmonella enterica subsp. enterica serovar Abony]
MATSPFPGRRLAKSEISQGKTERRNAADCTTLTTTKTIHLERAGITEQPPPPARSGRCDAPGYGSI